MAAKVAYRLSREEKMILLAEHVRAVPAKEAKALVFLSRLFVQVTLPHSNPETTDFVRVNGRLRITITAPSHRGLPWGRYPRLILVWMITFAVLNGPVIRLGGSFTSFMKKVGVEPTGGKTGTISRFLDQFRRLMTVTINCDSMGEYQEQMINVRIVHAMDLWWGKGREARSPEWEATIVLSDEFYWEISRRRIPIDMRVYSGLTHSPFAMDIYVWASYRRARLKGRQTIKWSELQLQFGCGYPNTSEGLRDFKANFKDAARLAAIFDPKISACFIYEDEHIVLLPGEPHVPTRSAVDNPANRGSYPRISAHKKVLS